MKNTFQLQQLLALHYVYPLTLNRFQKLLQNIHSMDDFEKLSPTQLKEILQISHYKAKMIIDYYKKILNIHLQKAYISKCIHAIDYTSEYYPSSLLQLTDPPTVLYAKGDISLLKERYKIAIIGSRNATKYSVKALNIIVPPLVKQRCVIVSGLARGADGFAHQAAIKFGGKTIAVLGHGLFHLYPKENKPLADEIAKHHLLLSEYPPYVGVKKWHFPARNRIISGISDAVVITESSSKSGTLITAEFALEQGKDVFIVPGPIDSELSKGTNQLLYEGAIPIWDGVQIIQHLKMFSRKY